MLGSPKRTKFKLITGVLLHNFEHCLGKIIIERMNKLESAIPIKKAIIFDLDDTLVDTFQCKWDQHKETARRFYGIDLDESTLKLHWGKPSRELVEEFYISDDTVDEKLQKFRSLDNHFLKTLKAETLPTLGSLATSGIILGIVSNARKESAHNDLQRLKLPTDYFDFIHTYEDTGTYKPDPAAFTLATSHLRTRDIEDITYVGDSLADFEAARGAGLKFIGVTTGITTESEFTSAGAINVIRSLHELLPLA